eukprot:m.149605 g.149605  ORF g.149605 m.149605 type:complete len:307 (-) comp17824_c0_seq1:31-951(-)
MTITKMCAGHNIPCVLETIFHSAMSSLTPLIVLALRVCMVVLFVCSDPCLPDGYTTTLAANTVEEYMTDICLDGFLTKEPFVIRNYTVTGAADLSTCTSSVEQLFSRTNFSIPRARQPAFPTDATVYAVSAYWYAVEFLFLHTPNNPCAAGQCQKSLSEIRSRLTTVCSLSWQQLLDTYNDTSLKFLPDYCFQGTYMVNLLTELGQGENASNIIFAGTVDGNEVGWNFGLALNATRSLPSLAKTQMSIKGKSKTSVSKEAFAASAALSTVVFLAGVVILVKQIGNRNRRGDYDALQEAAAMDLGKP